MILRLSIALFVQHAGHTHNTPLGNEASRYLHLLQLRAEQNPLIIGQYSAGWA